MLQSESLTELVTISVTLSSTSVELAAGARFFEDLALDLGSLPAAAAAAAVVAAGVERALFCAAHSACESKRGRAEAAGGVGVEAKVESAPSMATSNPVLLPVATNVGGGGKLNSRKMERVDSDSSCLSDEMETEEREVAMEVVEAASDATAADACKADADAAVEVEVDVGATGPWYLSCSQCGRSVTFVRMVARSRHSGMCASASNSDSTTFDEPRPFGAPSRRLFTLRT